MKGNYVIFLTIFENVLTFVVRTYLFNYFAFGERVQLVVVSYSGDGLGSINSKV